MSGRSGQGTPRQTVRCPEDLWIEFGEKAGDQERSEVLRQFIRWYVGKGELPPRPGSEDPPASQ